MRDLIDRYLDGQLTDQESEVLLQGLRQDPALERELREYEEILAAAARSEAPLLAPDFTDRVMARIHQDQARLAVPRHRARLLSGRSALALAASLLLVFSMGYLTARTGILPGQRPRGGVAGPAGIADHGGTAMPVGAADRGGVASELANLNPGESSPAVGKVQEGLHLVRLVYQPRQADVSQVAIAGTFNGWNPAFTPMRLEGEIWTALLILPPDTYEYMFVENGRDWITDPLALQTRDDGFGRMNAVMDLSL